MIKNIFTLLVILLCPMTLQAGQIGSQTTSPGAVIDYSAAKELRIPSGLLANITPAPAVGALYYVTDGANGTDCSTGLGTITVLCLYNGATWETMDDPDGYRADLQTLSGMGEGDTNLATFTGSTIPDNQMIKQAIQSLETAVEVRNTSPTGINIFTSDDCTLVSGMVEGDLCFEY